jgi:signal transduction histidine kinase
VTRLHPVLLVAYVDPQRMIQVITNLVGNAINYTSEGGQITVELETEGRRAVLRVRDTGIGIAPAMVEHIFEPFFRAEERAAIGTGLGLTITREIVLLHGGEIDVESEVGQGSTFTVKIDLLAE